VCSERPCRKVGLFAFSAHVRGSQRRQSGSICEAKNDESPWRWRSPIPDPLRAALGVALNRAFAAASGGGVSAEAVRVANLARRLKSASPTLVRPVNRLRMKLFVDLLPPRGLPSPVGRGELHEARNGGQVVRCPITCASLRLWSRSAERVAANAGAKLAPATPCAFITQAQASSARAAPGSP
jgi:hypothetical protein